MGQDFRALFSHHLTYDELLDLPRRLNDLYPSLLHYFEIARLHRVRWSWRGLRKDVFEQWFDLKLSEDGVAYLFGSDAIWIAFNRSSGKIGSWVRWREFTSDASIMQCMRVICCQIARTVNAPILIYIPDSAYGPAERASDSLFTNGIFDHTLGELGKDAGEPLSFAVHEVRNGYFLENVAEGPTPDSRFEQKPDAPTSHGRLAKLIAFLRSR